MLRKWRHDRYQKSLHARGWYDLFRPPQCFFKMYILRHGFLDGIHGIILCGLSCCTVFIKYAKLWNLERLNKAGEKVNLTRN